MPEVIQSPNDQLADQVVAKLKELHLLKDSRAGEATRLLKTKKVTTSDWRIWAEECVEAEANLEAN